MPVNIIDTLKPKNGLSFPVVEAIDVFVENYGNLADAISHFATDAMIAAINAVLSGKANTSDVNTAVSNLQNQINQIEISASAEAVVAPEVAGARVGADGTSYQTLKARLDAEANANKQSDADILKYIADIDGKKRFDPADYEQGGITVEGAPSSSNNFVRTINYVPNTLQEIYFTGLCYVKVYKNGTFIGNYNPGGAISTTQHLPWTSSIAIKNLYSIDADYLAKIVYSKGASILTSPSDVINIYSISAESELSKIDNDIIKRRTINPTDYEYTVAKISNQGEFTIRPSENWIDLPDELLTGNYLILIVYKYHSEYSLQTLYNHDLKKTARRLVTSAGAAYTTWVIDEAYTEPEEPESETILPSDFEQGGINSAGTEVSSNNYVRTKAYISPTIGILSVSIGGVFVKIYKENSFVGNLEPDGSITHTDSHSQLTGTVFLSQIYDIDSDYRIRLVYTTNSATTVDDVTNIKSYNTGDSLLNGRKISIYGDSISTYAGYIPEGNRVYYTGSNAGVTSVFQTWWYETILSLNANLKINNSWSGRCVSNKRDAEDEMINSGAWRQSEVDKLSDASGDPDIIIVKLGINDFNNRVAIGTYDAKEPLPTVTAEGPSTFREAYAIMLDRLMTTYPLAKIYCCTLNQCERSGSVGFPEINGNGDAISDFNKAIRELSAAFGAEIIDHSASGMTYYNLSTYAGDYSSSTGQGLHPNQKGMALLANKSIMTLDPSSKVRF